MNEKLTKALFEDFPKLYSDKDKSPSETLICFGFECSDGWEPLIRECSEKLEAINNTTTESKWIRASQVKEKFATLRFYIDTCESERMDWATIRDIISKAEDKSEITCEECSKSGRIRTSKRWMVTLCDVCEDKRK